MRIACLIELTHKLGELQEVLILLRESVTSCPINVNSFSCRYENLTLRWIVWIYLDDADAMQAVKHAQLFHGVRSLYLRSN